MPPVCTENSVPTKVKRKPGSLFPIKMQRNVIPAVSYKLITTDSVSGFYSTVNMYNPSIFYSIYMCETVLLYLGNKLYGVLRHKPFSIERPVTIDLDDTQRLRLMHHDHNLHEAYLEMRIDSTYEWYVRDEEIDELEPPKPVPNMISPTVFDIDYVLVKQESSDSAEENTSAVIGHLLHQPANVAKEIKQELINCAAHTIAGRHTESCEIAQFVSDKGSSCSTLQIEDVRSLLSVGSCHC